MIPVLRVDLPDYLLHPTFPGIPDSVLKSAGEEIAAELRRHFTGKRVLLRLLSTSEHPGKKPEELIELIQSLGHDRYDSSRSGDRYENLEGERIDIFALDIQVGCGESEVGIQDALQSFFYFPLQTGSVPIIVDLGIVYDAAQLSLVEHHYAGREAETKRDGYIFNNPDAPTRAVLAILHLSRA